MTPSSGHTVQQLSAPSSAFLSNIVHLFEVSVQDNNDDLDEAFAGLSRMNYHFLLIMMSVLILPPNPLPDDFFHQVMKINFQAFENET